MANATHVFYETARDAYNTADGSTLHWDAVPIEQDQPWFNVFKVSDPELNNILCPDQEGEATFQFDGNGHDRYGIYDQIEAFHLAIGKIGGMIGDFYYWHNRTTGVRSLGTEAEGYHHYIFEIVIRWEKTTNV